ncbi:MAG: hypothetical protein EXR48_05600 [Dehalococcoidia bacterium]|nr:hypothetical protein [Dehalococcoidia bacterium]
MNRDVNAVKALQHSALNALRRAVERQSLPTRQGDP